MKRIASLSLFAALLVGFAGAAKADPVDMFDIDVLTAARHGLNHDWAPYHSCHGRTSGTAHASCGTLTGGPSGGLF